jgi:eukaryotic translation initiation factor 2C
MIDKLDEMMIERIDDFKLKNQNKLPANIIFYRDGVSEGQFDQVLSIELPQIKEAFKKLGTAKVPYNPKLTIVICGMCISLLYDEEYMLNLA